MSTQHISLESKTFYSSVADFFFFFLACWKVLPPPQTCFWIGLHLVGITHVSGNLSRLYSILKFDDAGALTAQSTRRQTHREGIIWISQQKQYIQHKDNNVSGVKSFSGWKGGTGSHQNGRREKKKKAFKLKHSHHYSSITGCFFFSPTINVHKSTRLQYSATQTYCF